MGAITAADDLVFVAGPDGTVNALEAATGVTRWSYPSGLVKESPYAGGIVYVSSASRHVYALDAETGSPVWRTPVLPDPGPATVVGETVFVIGSDPYLHTFDRQTGAQRSEVRLAEQRRFAVDTADGDLYVVSTGAPSADKFLHAYTANGTLRRVATVPISGTPVVADGHVYLRGQAFDADTGDLVWTEVGSAFSSSPAVAYGNVYVARTFNAPLVALDPANGHIRRSAVVGTSWPADDDGPAVANDIVWVHADRTLTAFDAHTGAALWSATAPFELSESRMPVVAGGQVHSVSQDATRLVAFALPLGARPPRDVNDGVRETAATRVRGMAAPGGTGPIGPFPPRVEADDAQEEYDKLRRRLLWTLPSGLYVVGSRSGARRNLMTLNWATQVSFDPKLIGIGVEKTALTHQLIAAGGSFTLNTVARDDRAIVRKFTKPVEHDSGAGTLNGFPFHDGPTGAPILDQAAAWLDCEVRTPVDCGDHTFFIGEIVDCAFTGAEDTEVLRMEDTRMSYGG